ncbi:MBOAT family O-acyltransferase [Acetanaerobacterium elongatum]|uniref:Alginate O-acetyltransferase complex protein AlgI n=1 Tax=Acetanaerobacterium elongatum TaxID=258515 RepID=A0A1H0BZG2_9FIRM|nr:MBOAT family protein [Acetanaerobacterium elongatum]SDN51009.1 alginate O-acetyltransferase complex protein AlgI [Acetanaerobacterium elongatum]
MVFSSLTFIYLYLPIVLICYFAVPKKARNFVLFVSGFVFYAWGEPVYVLLMSATILLDYTCGRLMARFDERQRVRQILLISSIVVNLSILAIFKYNSFAVQNINTLFGLTISDPKIALPIGISFYTFQSMSYTIDLYWRKVPVQKNFIDYASYVSMFPQLVAGPIVRYNDVQRELSKRSTSITNVGDGAGIFIQGLAKKVLLANNIGTLWTLIKSTPIENLSTATAWFGILAFTFQIYFDFSGYSDMAVGMGRMLGFHFPQNFNYPYVSKSVTDFWRRWHMTLGTWFREYVYIPLGGNRKGMLRTVLNLLIVWMLTGLWHGASWNFVLWGLYYGILLIIERLFLSKVLAKIPFTITRLYTFFCVVMGWVLFEFDDVGMAFRYYGALFGANGKGTDAQFVYLLMSYGLIFALCVIFATDWAKKLVFKIYRSRPGFVKVAAVVLQVITMLVCTAYLVDATYNPFLYFRF